MKIKNFLQISNNIASSGQPLRREFPDIAKLGYETVINLALSSSDNAIPDESDLVTELGMSYIHIPVQWDNPTQDQFDLFAIVMQQQMNKKVWVHCALNMRVSAFLYLYSTLYLNVPNQSALRNLNKIWQPNETWARFITAIKEIKNERLSSQRVSKIGQ